MSKLEEMKALVEELNKASDAYYNTGNEIMTNFEYDEKYSRLQKLEAEHPDMILENSPTKNVGYQVVDELPKEVHEYPALSLDKTKDMEAFKKVFAVRDNLAVCMWKMDGSTVQLTYDNGTLTKAVTRGNGEVGSVISHNAPFVKGIPSVIPYKGHLVVRGEVVMSYEEFNRVNESLPEGEEPYKNPRNLANATIQLLDSKEMAKRELWFHAFKLVHADDAVVSPRTFFGELEYLKEIGFNVVEHELADATADPLTSYNAIENVMTRFSRRAEQYLFPVDGLVVASNDVCSAEEQPGTGHHPNKLVGYAFKWQDETAETKLLKIEWSASRTGLLNPVAVFEPVELEGTTVSRASVHNVSEVERLNLHEGDIVSVYKANKIIPQIEANITGDEYEAEFGHPFMRIPPIDVCPVCGHSTEVVTSRVKGSLTKTLWCKNPDCAAKHIGKFVHFCERDCMNIKGMSEATIEKFVQKGWIKELNDIYNVGYNHKEEIVAMEGFGEKSLQNMEEALEKSRHTSFIPFIHALGIPNVGKGQAKLLCKAYNGDVTTFFEDVYNRKSFQHIEGIGEVIEDSLLKWGNEYLRWLPWKDDVSNCPNCNTEIQDLLLNMIFEKEERDISEINTSLEGQVFVITGEVHIFKNRAELQEKIESLGGKATGSVTSKTSYLINNDVESTSSKNKKAKELGVPIISEEDFVAMIGE